MARLCLHKYTHECIFTLFLKFYTITDTTIVTGLGIVMSLIIVGVIVAVFILSFRRRIIHQNKDSSAPEPSNGT